MHWFFVLFLQDDLFQLSLEELMQVEVAVGTKSDLGQLETPSTVTFFSKEYMQSLGLRSLEELINYVAGGFSLITDDEGRSYAPSFRGRRGEGTGRDLLVLLNGQRLNDVTVGGTFAQVQEIPIQMLEKVEIIRGNGSVLYGANAFTAVISITTVKDLNYVEVGTGSFNGKSGTLATSQEFRNCSLQFFGRFQEDEGQNYPAFYPFYNSFEDTQDPKKHEDLLITFSYKSFHLSAYKHHRTYDDFVIGGGQMNGLQSAKTTNQFYRADWEHQFKHMKWQLYFEYSKGVYDVLLGITPENPPETLISALSESGLYWTDGSRDPFVGGNIKDLWQKSLGTSIQFPVKKHDLQLGLEWRREANSLNPFQGNWDAEILEASFEIVPAPPSNPIQAGFWNAFGTRFDVLQPGKRIVKSAFLLDRWSLTSQKDLHLGLRWDQYDDFGSHLSFRGAYIASGNDQSFRVQFGNAFRAPSFMETRSGIATGGISNPDLKPEEVISVELGWRLQKSQYDSNLTFFVNRYSDLVENVLVDDVVPGFTAFQPQNQGQLTMPGLEWEFKFETQKQWLLVSTLGHVFDNVDSESVPQTNLSMAAIRKYGKYVFGFGGHWHSKIKASIESIDREIDSYALFAANFDIELLPQLHLHTSLHNIFDEEIFGITNQFDIEPGLPTRGFEWQVDLRLNW